MPVSAIQPAITRRRKGGRKPSGLPVMTKTIRVRDDQKVSGQASATEYRTCDDILRWAIDEGLPIVIAKLAACPVPDININPADWE